MPIRPDPIPSSVASSSPVPVASAMAAAVGAGAGTAAVSHGGAGPPVVESSALFGRARELRIVHEGFEYRLRVTRQGKLLLTK